LGKRKNPAVKARGLRTAVIALLAVEVVDELVFGAREAAWPLIRDDLELSYTQIGLLVGVPAALGTLLEPPLGILGDAWRRDRIVAFGGIAFAAGLLVFATAMSFSALLVAFVVIFAASGAFVSLSQATLMDADPGRRELNMTRWSVAGGLGAVAGPLVLSVFVFADLGWRGLFAAFAVLTIPLIPLVARRSSPAGRRSIPGRRPAPPLPPAGGPQVARPARDTRPDARRSARVPRALHR
jgi:MFS transporter, FSR family, fosmidomycin resistance protein